MRFWVVLCAWNKSLGLILRGFSAEVVLQEVFISKQGWNRRILTLWKTGIWVETVRRGWGWFQSPFQPLSSPCSSAVPITGSCCCSFLFLFSFWVIFPCFFGTQEGSEGGLCMVPGVCCVLGWGVPIFQSLALLWAPWDVLWGCFFFIFP